MNYDLFNNYRDLQWWQIDRDLEPSPLEKDELLRDVVGAYGRFDGAALSTMTHREEPWLATRGDLPETQGSTRVISKDVIRSYFKRMIREDVETDD